MNKTSRTYFAKPALVLLILLSWITTVWPIAARVHADDRDTVLILGDSISAAYGLAIEDGWVAKLQSNFDEEDMPLKVVNASVTGDTSSNGLGRLPALLAEYEPEMLIIELGGNDGLRGLSIKKLKSNLIEMAELAKDYGALPVIVAVQLPGNYGKAYNKLFANAFVTAAEQTGATLVSELFKGMDASDQWFQSDGIHPSARAQPIMLENVWRVVEPLLMTEAE